MAIALLLPSVAALLLPAAPATGTHASIVFVAEQARSPFGATSPQPAPLWSDVATHLAMRLPGFDERIRASVVAAVVVALGVSDEAEPSLRAGLSEQAAALSLLA